MNEQPNKQEDWGIAFDQKFSKWEGGGKSFASILNAERGRIKDFIRQLLSSQKSKIELKEHEKCAIQKVVENDEAYEEGKSEILKELEERIERMKLNVDGDAPWFGQTKKVEGYNQALKGIQSLINELAKKK